MNGFQWHKRVCEVATSSHDGMVWSMQECQEKPHTSCSSDIVPEGAIEQLGTAQHCSQGTGSH